MNEIAQKLFENEEFLKKILPMEPAEVVKVFEAEGGEITEAELLEIAAEVKKQMANDELDESALDDVAGGLTNAQKKYMKAVTFAVVAVGVGAAALCSW